MPSEGQCTFEALDAPEGLSWAMDGPDGGELRVQAGGKSAVYGAPFVMETRTATLRILGEAFNHAVTITLSPDPVWRTMKDVWGADWKTPRMEILVRSGPGPGFPGQALDINYVDDRALGNAHRKWVITEAGGTCILDGSGKALPIPGDFGVEPPMRSPGPALRPPGSTVENPLHFVFADYRDFAIRAWDPIRGARILAGFQAHSGAEDGPETTFSPFNSLVLDRFGNVFVADGSNGLIRRIARDGMVTTLAGKKGRRGHEDGAGPDASFHDLSAIALDHGTGTLYVLDNHAVRSISSCGAVATLVGNVQSPGFQPVPDGEPVPVGTPCFRAPAGLQVHKGRLFIADTRNHAIRVFDLSTRRLYTLAGDPTQPKTREGPLRHFRPDLPLTECAALRWPVCIAINEDGACLVGLEDCIVQLELADFNASPTRPTGGT